MVLSRSACVALICLVGLVLLNLPLSTESKLQPTALTLHNPTVQELVAFLERDKVHLRRYGENGTYTCYFFAHDFKQEANAANLQCALCYVIFHEGSDGTWGHFVNALSVTDDSNLTFVEPQTATIIALNVGAVYLNRTVVDLSVVW